MSGHCHARLLHALQSPCRRRNEGEISDVDRLLVLDGKASPENVQILAVVALQGWGLGFGG